MSTRVSLKTWLAAARLRTLPLALSAILLGSLLAKFFGAFSLTILLLCLFTAIFYQVLSNFANDLGDGIKGTDANKVGEKRAIASGSITVVQMKNAVVLFSGLSLISGSFLSWFATVGQALWITILFISLGFAATFAALSYTLGKRAYGYSGWGDLFVLIFFGWLGVLGAFFLQAKMLPLELLLPASAVGFLAMGVLNLNNMRDVENDRLALKNTVVVKMGIATAKKYQLFLLIGALTMQSIFVLRTTESRWAWLFLLVTPLIVINAKKAWQAKESKDFDPLLKPLAITTLLFCLLAGIGQNL